VRHAVYVTRHAVAVAGAPCRKLSVGNTVKCNESASLKAEQPSFLKQKTTK
jgi:hypothetical protein